MKHDYLNIRSKCVSARSVQVRKFSTMYHRKWLTESCCRKLCICMKTVWNVWKTKKKVANQRSTNLTSITQGTKLYASQFRGLNFPTVFQKWNKNQTMYICTYLCISDVYFSLSKNLTVFQNQNRVPQSFSPN